jgi:hypothetical protein
MKSITEQFNKSLSRCVTLAGYTIGPDGSQVDYDKAVREFMTTLAKEAPTEKEMANQIIEAWGDKTGTLQRALCAMRVETVSNFIATESLFMSGFFTTQTLLENEEPYIANDTKNEIRVGHIGEDGTPDRVRILKPESKTAIALRMISSQIVRYKTMDIYKGNVKDSALKTIDIARDLTFQLDREHYRLLVSSVANGGAFGAFSTEQSRTAKERRIYLPHSGIITSHLPSTNDIVNGTVSGPSGTRWTTQYYDPPSTNLTGFRPAVLRCIIDYVSSWGNVLPGGGMLVPTGEIIVPSSDIINIGLGLLPTNTDTQNSLQQQVQDNGYFRLSLLGRDWRFIPDLTIESGTCYPIFNMKPGISFRKPSWDKEFVITNEPENFEERSQRKVYGATIVSQWRPRAMRIKYIA